MAMMPIFILACCVYSSLLIATIYFSGATWRRVAGAVAGGAATALVGVGVEALAHARGWWKYTSDDTLVGPVVIYPAIVLILTFLALIGWIVTCRFGGRGLAVFLGVLAIVGTLRDYLIAGKLMGLIVFAPGVLLWIIDGLLWAGLTGLAILVMRWVSGPARIDRPASRPGDSVYRAKGSDGKTGS